MHSDKKGFDCDDSTVHHLLRPWKSTDVCRLTTVTNTPSYCCLFCLLLSCVLSEFAPETPFGHMLRLSRAGPCFGWNDDCFNYLSYSQDIVVLISPPVLRNRLYADLLTKHFLRLSSSASTRAHLCHHSNPYTRHRLLEVEDAFFHSPDSCS